MARIIGISDIHGEYEKLCCVIDKISPQKSDTIVFMGDYIDRGPKSREVVDKLIETGDICNCVYLIGSHEYALMHASKDEYYNYLFWNYGGPKTVESYGSFENIFNIHGDFFNNLQYYHIIDNYLFVHAGIRPGVPMEEQSETDMVYIRDSFIYSPHGFDKKIIFGHTEFSDPLIMNDKICIDTGCGKYKDAFLTAIVIEQGKENFVTSGL